MARIHWEEGELEEAGLKLEESLQLRRDQRVKLGNRPDVLGDLAAALINLGMLRGRQGKHDEATDRFEEALNLARNLRNIGTDNPEILQKLADSLHNCAIYHLQRLKADAALPLLREVVELFRELAPHPSIGDVEHQRFKSCVRSLAAVERQLGNIAEATRLDAELTALDTHT
jgi:tetratricopeptide (TPR) repeat protein